MTDKICVVVPWHNEEQIAKFLDAWALPISEMASPSLDWLVLQRDLDKEGCAVTKNKGVRAAMERGADIVVILDDDCFPEMHQIPLGVPASELLPRFAKRHADCLQPQPVTMYLPVTDPPSRGTPFRERTVKLPVAASMGFWTDVGDYDAPSQLVHGATKPMEFRREPQMLHYFSLCGMNLAFRPKDWLPWCEFIDVPRFDDIWMGWLWQREAYRRGYCFNLNGPLVRHSRQSNVWKNLEHEARWLETSETLWRKIATHQPGDYATLRGLLPV